MNTDIKLLVEKLFDDNDELLNNDELTLNELNIHDNLSDYKYFPKNKRQLKKIIKEHIAQGKFNLNDIDVRSVTEMSKLFKDFANYNLDVSKWDVSMLEDFSFMFYKYPGTRLDLSKWNVSSAKNMNGMFEDSAFDGDISKWNVSSVESMHRMFYANKNFCNEFSLNIGISEWKVGNVSDMSFMFDKSHFTGDISKWDVSNVIDFSCMFNCNVRFNGDLGNWLLNKTYKEGINMMAMFSSTNKFTGGNIGNWDISNVSDISSMFRNTKVFNTDLSNWDISNVEEILFTFEGAKAFNHDISSWSIKDKWPRNMFLHCNINPEYLPKDIIYVEYKVLNNWNEKDDSQWVNYVKEQKQKLGLTESLDIDDLLDNDELTLNELNIHDNLGLPHYVDLGLPSGTLWYDRNFGAKDIELPGTYLSFKELRNNVQSKGYCIPTSDLWNELYDECVWTWCKHKEMNGYEIRGKNGEMIFLPAGGSFSKIGSELYNKQGRYWLSSKSDSDYNNKLLCCTTFSDNAYSTRTIYHSSNYLLARTVLKSKVLTEKLFNDNDIDLLDNDESTETELNIANNLKIYKGKPVDLGLPSGTLWYDRNLGAEKPEDFGKYYQWGDTEGYYNNTNKEFTWDTYKFINKKAYDKAKNVYPKKNVVGNSPTTMLTKYNVSTKDKFLKTYDNPAYLETNGEGTLPTVTQIKELCKYCFKLEDLNTNLMKFTSKLNGNFIYFPLAGFYAKDLWGQTYWDECGRYWGLSREKTYYSLADDLDIRLKPYNPCDNGHPKCYGQSIRPVVKK